MKSLLLFILFILNSSAWANEVGFTLSQDSNSGRSSNIDGTIAIGSELNLLIGAGSSRDLGADTREATSRSLYAGVGTNGDSDFSVSGMAKYWGLKDELSYGRFLFPVLVRTEDWRFKVTAGLGRITFESNTDRAREETIQDRSLALGVRYVGLEGWSFGLRGENHDFSKNLTQFSGDRIARLYSESTLLLLSGIAKSDLAVEVVYSFEKLDLGAEAGKTVSAFDELETKYSSVFVAVTMDKNWMFDIAFGRTDDVRYGSVGVSYQF